MNVVKRALRTRLGISAAVLMSIVILAAIVAPIFWGDAANVVDTGNLLAGPSAEHLVGTDNLGRDLLLRVLVATRLSVGLALLATAVSVIAGLILGVAPQLLGGRFGKGIVWGTGIAVAFPGLLLALFFAAIFGSGSSSAVLAIGLAGAPGFARLCQTLISGAETRDYVSAARIGGVGRIRILTQHILPNIGEPIIVNVTIGAGSALLAFAGLSFLGIGVQPPDYDWGRLMMDGLQGIYNNPLAALAPGIAVLIAGLAFNLVGEAAARALGIEAFGMVTALKARIGRGKLAPVAASEVQLQGDDVVLQVDSLHVEIPGESGPIRPVRGVTFSIHRGQIVGIVGESGSGKSLTALAIAQLLEKPIEVDAALIRFSGSDLLNGDAGERRKLLGTSLAMVFQDPMTSFNPTKRMGIQLAEVATEHGKLNRRDALARAAEKMSAVQLSDPQRRIQQYPHEFSGGMRQRAMIGMGLMAEPKLIIADEPTTALDVTVQRRVLDLLQRIRTENDVAILLISHDVTVVAEICDRVLVMYAGRIVEDLPAADLDRAQHPYTRALLAAVPDMTTDITQPLATVPGRAANPANIPAGCAYAARCPLADAHCRVEDPELVADAEGRRVACWHAGEPVPLVLGVGGA